MLKEDPKNWPEVSTEEIEKSLKEAFAERSKYPCTDCNGNGTTPGRPGVIGLGNSCWACHGTGKVAERRKENSDPRIIISKIRKIDGLCIIVDPKGYIRLQQRGKERRDKNG